MIAKEIFVESITKRIIPVISRKILMESKPFSNESNQFESIKKEYARLLGQRYDLLSSHPKFMELSPTEIVEKISNLDIRIISGLSLDQLKQMYLTDESLDQLRTICSQAFENAKSFYAGAPVIMVEDANKYIAEMKKIVRSVKSYNRDTALLLLSEASADLAYATGESDAVSLRFHDYVESLKKREK